MLGIPAADPDRLVFVERDREEELIAVARRVEADDHDHQSLARVAVVYKRPLPYLYLAREVFGGAGIPYQAFDALPLAAEPFAAALDLVFEFVESSFTRAALVALLRSPHFVFEGDASLVDRGAIATLDRILSERRYLGGLERLAEIEATWPEAESEGARLAIRVALAAARTLAPLLVAGPASTQYRRVIGFLDVYGVRRENEVDPLSTRLGRARQAVGEALEALAAAHAAHDDAPIAIGDVAVGRPPLD